MSEIIIVPIGIITGLLLMEWYFYGKKKKRKAIYKKYGIKKVEYRFPMKVTFNDDSEKIL